MNEANDKTEILPTSEPRALRSDKCMGKRREFLRNLLIYQGLRKTLSSLLDESTDSGSNLSEYIDEYCQRNFIPVVEKIEILMQNQEKFPLYSTNCQTFDYERVLTEFSKRHPVQSKLSEPFRRNCTFSTPIEDRLDD